MSCLILDPLIPEQLERAVALLRANEAVALPTETVYGLAARVAKESALARVFALKARPTFDPLIVHVLDATAAQGLVTEWSPLHAALAERFWPGPLTLLAPKNPARVPDLCTAGSSFVALRAPRHPAFRAVLAQLGEPLAAPSANRFGRISPTTAEDAVTELGPWGLEAVVEGGACEKGVESTIVRVSSPLELEVLRPGALSLEELRAGLPSGVRVRVTERAVLPKGELQSPGQLESHYAPATPLYFLERGEGFESLPESVRAHPERHALLLARAGSFSTSLNWGLIEALSSRDSDTEAAARLFGVLRKLDRAGFAGIVACASPDEGLGLALNDRLRRAGASTRGAR